MILSNIAVIKEENILTSSNVSKKKKPPAHTNIQHRILIRWKMEEHKRKTEAKPYLDNSTHHFSMAVYMNKKKKKIQPVAAKV